MMMMLGGVEDIEKISKDLLCQIPLRSYRLVVFSQKIAKDSYRLKVQKISPTEIVLCISYLESTQLTQLTVELTSFIMFASVNYDSIPNVDNGVATSSSSNDSNKDNVDDEASSLLFAGAGTSTSRWMRTRSPSRTVAFAAAGFMFVVLLATMAWDGDKQVASPLQQQQQWPMWGRSRSSSSAKSDIMDDDDDSGKEVDNDRDSDSDSDVTTKHSKVPKCTFLECWEASCSWTEAPYVCLMNNGGPHMGWYVLLGVVYFCTSCCSSHTVSHIRSTL